MRSARFHGDGHDIRQRQEMFCDNTSGARQTQETRELRRQQPPISRGAGRRSGCRRVGSLQKGKSISEQSCLMGRRSHAAASSCRRRAWISAGRGTWVSRVLGAAAAIHRGAGQVPRSPAAGGCQRLSVQGRAGLCPHYVCQSFVRLPPAPPLLSAFLSSGGWEGAWEVKPHQK